MTWVDVIKAGVRAMRTKVNATFTLAKLTMWTDFKRLLSTAESRMLHWAILVWVCV